MLRAQQQELARIVNVRQSQKWMEQLMGERRAA